jgi:hypothetical protein
MLHLCGRKLERPNEMGETDEVATNASKISPSTPNAAQSDPSPLWTVQWCTAGHPHTQEARAHRMNHAHTAGRETPLEVTRCRQNNRKNQNVVTREIVTTCACRPNDRHNRTFLRKRIFSKLLRNDD